MTNKAAPIHVQFTMSHFRCIDCSTPNWPWHCGSDILPGSGPGLSQMPIPLGTKLWRHPYRTGSYEGQEGAAPGGFPTDLRRLPGYPAFLAVVNAPGVISDHRASIVQCAAGAVFVALLAFLCRLIANSSIGLLAGLFYATDWITIVHTPMVIAKTIYCITLGLASAATCPS